MLKTTLLNGITNERDKDYTALGLQSIRPGVIAGLEITTNSISAGLGFIKINRTAITPNEEALILVTLSASEVIDTSGTKKFWIEINQNNINDPALNDEGGTIAGTIESGASYPAGNYIPLADIIASAITDEREVSTVKSKNISGAEIFLEADAGGTKIILKDISGDEADLEADNLYAITDIFLNWIGTDQPFWLPVLGADGKIKPGQIGASDVEATLSDLIAGSTINQASALYSILWTWKIAETDASNSGKIKFIWFANASWILDDTISTITSGVAWNFTGLTIGSDYYLADTPIIDGWNIIQSLWAQTGGESFVWQSTVWNFHKQGQDVEISWEIILRNITVDLSKVWTPPSNIQCKVFHFNKVSLLWTSTNVFSSWDLTTWYTSKTFLFDDIAIPAYWTIFIEFSVDWAKSNSAYYRVAYNEWDVTPWFNHYYETWSGSWTTRAWQDTKYDIQLGEKDPVSWLISTVPGTNNVKVGRAISDTKLLVNSGWF